MNLSIDHICKAQLWQGNDCNSPPSLLIELPHGATKAAHYEHTYHQLHGPFPENLQHFFFVNTDVGSTECAEAIAAHVITQHPNLSVLVFQSLIPRTFIDCNRVIGLDPSEFAAGGVTPGLPSYITSAQDKSYLIQLHKRYQDQVNKAYEWVCGNGGLALMLHSYAPKTVGIKAVDNNIVANLHRVYQPAEYEQWPTRPQFDVITTDLEGNKLCDIRWSHDLQEILEQHGWQATEGHSYPLHPSTTGYHHALRYPKQSLCLEIRRDILMKSWQPFEEMQACPDKLANIAPLIARSIVNQWQRST